MSVVGPIVRALRVAITTVYFPPFLAKGLLAPSLGMFWFYPILGAAFFWRRRWAPGAVVILLPLVCGWVFSAVVLNG